MDERVIISYEGGFDDGRAFIFAAGQNFAEFGLATLEWVVGRRDLQGEGWYIYSDTCLKLGKVIGDVEGNLI